MRHFFIFFPLLLAAFLPVAVAQTDGWTSTCPATYPSVSEVMIDACGDEFRSEYVVLRTKSADFDIRNFGLSVSNPFNSAFIGSVAVTNNSANADALQALNTSAGAACGYGTVFRNAFSAPYNGIIPPNSTVLVFNNRDSTDVTYLSPDALSRLCGSKVFVVFGTLTAQSRGVSIFRNYPQNGSCGTTGCLRKIDFAFNGQTCSQFTYDIKKLPHLNTTNPPAGFNEGSYLLPNTDGTLTYGGGNLTGTNLTCMPTARLACVIPPVPTYGDGFWNVLAFDGQNTYNTTDFKGFYTTDDHDPTTIPADTINGSFEFNTAFDGWKPNSAPSEAVAADGARTTYDGCNVRADSFSVLAKRQGFPCGFYKISLTHYDDNARIRIDADGNGVFEFDQSYAAPSCSTGCGPMIWQGDLGTRSRMEIYGSENRGSFNLHVVFQKDTVGHPSVKINILGTTAVACGGAPTGSISTSVTGGFAPYTITWRGPTAIPSGVFLPVGLPSGIFHATATDVLGCVDSAQILVPQTSNITVQAFGDATFCPNSTAILRGSVLGGTSPVTTNWLTSTSEIILSTNLNYSPIVSKSTIYILRATDASGCFKTDTVEIKTYNVQKIRVTVTPNDTICNDETTVFTARGSKNYTWTSFPQIGTAALNPQNATATLYALFLPAPVYTFYAAGQDANGCRDTGSVKVWINPLPVVTITPVMDTLCNDAPPYPLVGTPATGGRFFSRTCGNCVQNGLFYPNLAGVGAHEVQHEFIDANGCRNAPSILIKVKNCRCPSSDTVKISAITCNRLNVGKDTVKWQNRLGCDSLVITTRRLVLGDTVRLSATSCNPAKVRLDTIKFRNIFGCDSLVITNTRLAAADTTYRFGSTCNVLDSGVSTLRLVSSLGCDSIVITKTKLNKPDTTRSFSTTCNSLDSGTTTRRLQNQFGCDSIIILKTTLLRRDTTPFSQKICRNDSLRFGNQWLKTAGIFTRILRNTEGCDSTLILTLTVQDTNIIRRNATSCDPRRIGTDTLKLQNRVGCDSLIITTTRFANADTTRLDQTTCSVILIGSTTTRFTNRLGCDSIVITTFKLGKSDTTRLFSTTCNKLDSGTTTRRLQNQLGCDSIIILKTMLSRRDSIRLNQTICRNDSLNFGNQWLKTAGVFTKILKNTEGCDSTIILTLQLLKVDTTIVQKTTCNPSILSDRTRVLRNSRGCDSVVITQTRFVPSTMRIVLSISESISCNGGSNGGIKISTVQNAPPQYQALWSNGGKGPQIDSLRAGIYAVAVTDSAGCSVSDSIRLTEPPAIVVKATGIAPRCHNESLGGIRIDSIKGGTAAYTLIFRNTRSPISALPFKIDSVRLGFPVLQIVDSKSCNVPMTVEIPEAPDRSLELGSDRTILLGDSTLLTGFMNFKPKNLQWTWTPKDSSIDCSTCLPTYVKPTESTVYKLVARDSAGCDIDDQITISVNKPRHVFIPTTFSPNNDLVNDRFTIFGDASVRRVQSFKMFNRWGDPIFDQPNFPLNDEQAGWDGSVKGVVMPPDVYVYVVVVEFVDGKVVLYKGNVTLVK